MSLWYKCVARPAGGGAAGIVGQLGVRKAGVGRMGLYAAMKEWMASEEGATAVEYALMIALIALVIVVAVTFLGQETNSVYENGELITALT
jgi:pilus assembly protein Flp/PilA